MHRKSNVKEFRKHPHIPNSKVDYSHGPIINTRACSKSNNTKKGSTFQPLLILPTFSFFSNQKVRKVLADQGHKDAASGVVSFRLPQPAQLHYANQSIPHWGKKMPTRNCRSSNQISLPFPGRMTKNHRKWLLSRNTSRGCFSRPILE